MTTFNIGSLCKECERFWNRPKSGENGVIACRAFPDGIPAEIALDQFDHRMKHESDNGLQFKQYQREGD